MARQRGTTDRRQFIKSSAAAGAGFWVAGRLHAQESDSPNERIRFASIGVEGKGSSDSADAASNGDMVAICDVDEVKLGSAARKYPNAKRYTDFRKMLEEMGDQIDAVTVSTPDHTHAPAAVMAMNLGMHCFCQKPLTHSIWEARQMAKVAKEKNVATQMGNQGTAGPGLRQAAATIRKGTLGTVSEVHVWTNRPIWPQGGEQPEPKDIPGNLDWDLWLGPAKVRAYADGYHPFAWRGFWDFGTGALGDMACHTANMAFAALDLRNPVSVQAETDGHNGYSYPKWSIITFEFAANDWRPGLKMVWYDGGKRPDRELLDGRNATGSGSIVIGDKGKLYSPDDYGERYQLLGDIEQPEVEFERAPRGRSAHFAEWVRAIKGGKPAMSNFPDYSGALTETVLLGNLAVWATGDSGESDKIEWDAENLKAKNMPELDAIIRPEYREGYSLEA
ncbi:MAG: Gfo/Idh/MocA family oxidoreductase [Pirellulales bacterium]